ncbi:hypothetical protein P154DRAFT_519713 [Amniculicola lignicola CBS 123094]|uniref:Uncharacterized protein n=1 Tax=Amniculicola lignicola CBS 123094 TaxID=1392246 RepID=A0A6A5WTB0_9PLEO|nr:hypothetical protein P154DRAFT_519713 [Amniculicola lignicola CBS 123094]
MASLTGDASSEDEEFVLRPSGNEEEVLRLKPTRAFSLRCTTLERGSRLYTTERVLSVLEISDNENFGAKGPTKEELKFYLDTDAVFHLPVWPFNGSQTLSIFDADKHGQSASDVVERTAKPAQSLSQSHGLFDRHMCTMGGIHTPWLKTTSSPSDAKPELSTQSQSSDTKAGRVSAGLGHGVWQDEKLADVLGITPKDGTKASYDDKVEWVAKDNRRPWKAFADTTTAKKIVVEGHGWTEDGGLVLEGKGKVYAVYKPRIAMWKRNEKGEETKEVTSIDLRGIGQGALALFHDGLDDDIVRHLLLSAVAIEEQIMKSAGFDCRKYHGGW